jgi:hypothetical protein
MAFQISPGVNVSEIDLTTIIPVLGVSEGAYAGHFNWGPIDDIETIGDEIELVRQFGEPEDGNFVDFFTCANFLAYTNNLKVVRAANNACYNATANNAGIQIKNRIDYNENHDGTSNAYGYWAAKYAGTLGNSLSVSFFGSSNTTAFEAWTYWPYFDSAPATSEFGAAKNYANDEIHLVVVDENGEFTGVAGEVLERFSHMSKASDAMTQDGSSNYYKNVVNERSKYIWWLAHPGAATNWGTSANGTSFVEVGATANSLAGGTLVGPSNGDLARAYDRFKNVDEVDVALVLTGQHNSTIVTYIINNLAEYRKDCVVFVSPRRADVVNNLDNEEEDIVDYRKNSITLSSSYAVMDSNWKYQFDKYNNVYRWLPMNGDIAGLCARTDLERDPWWSPAGFNRGQIKNVVRLAWNPTKTDRDELYKNGINPVVTFPGEGTILFGDKTLQSRPSAFDRINVRRLFIVLEKAIARAAKYSLFEFNDQFTRAQFVALVEPYLRDVQGRRGIYQYRVVCDQTNNTPEVIDRNEFIGDIYIKPARSINFIQLNFVAVRTGVAFDEIVGKF